MSFGATRRFEMRDGERRAAIDLEAGSVLLITGDAIARWSHRVPKTTQPVGPRINLTFRHMVAAGVVGSAYSRQSIGTLERGG